MFNIAIKIPGTGQKPAENRLKHRKNKIILNPTKAT
jgi:hypothetical protein